MRIIIKDIFNKYKKYNNYISEPDECLNNINNDLLKLIGYKMDLIKDQDSQGIKLWEDLDKLMYKNGKVNKKKIESLLYTVPLYFLLSFLGYAEYKLLGLPIT